MRTIPTTTDSDADVQFLLNNNFGMGVALAARPCARLHAHGASAASDTKHRGTECGAKRKRSTVPVETLTGFSWVTLGLWSLVTSAVRFAHRATLNLKHWRIR